MSSYCVKYLNEKISEKITSLKKFKEFMNVSQESIIMLKDNEVEYANDKFLQMFQTTIDISEEEPAEARQESVRDKLIQMLRRSKKHV